MPTIEPTELIVVTPIMLVLFGPGKLPEIGKGIGKTIKELKSTTKEE